jgi:PPOX class probable F420-dependent enzyme
MTSTTADTFPEPRAGRSSVRPAPSIGATPAAPPLVGVHPLLVLVTLLLAAATLVGGVMALVSPGSYRDLFDLPASDAFVNLAGAFQVGVGTTLLLALIWRESLTVALAGTTLGGVLSTVAYAGADDAQGSTTALLAVGAVLAAVAFVVRYRELGLVVGDVGPGTADPLLAPFVRQKTILLRSYKRDGTPVGTPVSIAVDGDRAYFRSFTKAFKTRRIENNPVVEVVPSTAFGRPIGPGVTFRARLVHGPEAARAGRLLARKHPLMHGVLVPFGHKAGRKKTGTTTHYELVPVRD